MPLLLVAMCLAWMDPGPDAAVCTVRRCDRPPPARSRSDATVVVVGVISERCQAWVQWGLTASSWHGPYSVLLCGSSQLAELLYVCQVGSLSSFAKISVAIAVLSVIQFAISQPAENIDCIQRQHSMIR